MTAPFDLSETARLLSTTRAVRRRLDLERPVEREVILDCIRLSQQAPTASNTQKWRWMVVMDPDKRKALGEIYGRGKQFIEQAKAQIDADDTQTQRVYDSAGWLLDHIGEADAAAALQRALMASIAEGKSTADIGGDLSTTEFTAEVCRRMTATH